MAMDRLQEKIRKTKSVLMVDLSVSADAIPPHLLEAASDPASAALTMGKELMNALKGTVPALRFRFASYALLGFSGLSVLSQLLKKAASMGFYTVLDAPEFHSVESAEAVAAGLWGQESAYPCSALVINGYLGTDAIKAFLPYCVNEKKDLFVVVRTANRSASELQDLLAGSRTVHMAAADYVNRYGAETIGKYGYTNIGILASASSPDSLKNLRMKYPRMFILTDGLDNPGVYGKNCSNSADKLGHGTVVSVGRTVTGAWKNEESDGSDYLEKASAAVEKYQKNLNRFITVL